jgi:flagellar motor switch/type III secretory pathway protein FliN
MIEANTKKNNLAEIESSDETPTELSLSEYQTVENVKLPILAELDRGMISMSELLNLEIGDVLPFSRPIGENIDLFAADVLIGSAEVLAMNDKLAVRIADVNKKFISSQAKKDSLINSNAGSAPRIRRLAPHGS